MSAKRKPIQTLFILCLAMRRNFEYQEVNITLQAVMEIREDGRYRVRNVHTEISSYGCFERSTQQAMVVGMCVDVIEELTDLQVGEMLDHLMDVRDI